MHMKKFTDILKTILNFMLEGVELVVREVIIFCEEVLELLRKLDIMLNLYLLKYTRIFGLYLGIFYVIDEKLFAKYPTVTMFITITFFVVFSYIFLILFYHDQLISKQKFKVMITILLIASGLLLFNALDGDYQRLINDYISDSSNGFPYVGLLALYFTYKVSKRVFIDDSITASTSKIRNNLLAITVITAIALMLSYITFESFIGLGFSRYKGEFILQLKLFFLIVTVYISVVVLLWMFALLWFSSDGKKDEIYVRSNFVNQHRYITLFALMIPTFTSVFFIAFENVVPYEELEKYYSYHVYKAFRSVVYGFGSLILVSTSFSVLYLLYKKITEPRNNNIWYHFDIFTDYCYSN